MQMLQLQHEQLVKKINEPVEEGNGVFVRYKNPVLTAAHTPLFWRYDLNTITNPFMMERFGINATLNAGAIKFNGKYLLMVRVEGVDRKSFFAVAESINGIDNFSFWKYPVQMSSTTVPDTNIYDMRLVHHQDGWIYGLFCTERKDPTAKPGDESSAVAQCGIARTKDLVAWERLPDLITPSAQQRNVVLHPEFVHGKYALYTRPQDSFIEAGKGGGIGFALVEDICNAVATEEVVMDARQYHTISEMKNGQGPAPIKTNKGWLHLAHGVRNTAAGLRYVLYLFMTDLEDLTKILYKPAGYFLAPEREQKTENVSNVVFSNGWIKDDDGTIFIYYGSSDTRMHVAVSSVDKLVDYVTHTAPDGLSSQASVQILNQIINNNEQFLK
jgi:4-O-beta-D-mannosyl-D-glucose phosphorylase